MKELLIHIDRELLEELLENARITHPREVLLLLRGKIISRKGVKEIYVEDYLIPPMPFKGKNFSSFSLSMLPFDPRIVGTIHSHPSGVPIPSFADLNNFLGKFVAIMSYPYQSEKDVVAYDKNGRLTPIVID